MDGPNAPHETEEDQPLDPAAERVRRKLVRFMAINLTILFAAVMAVVLALVYKSLTPAQDSAASPASTVSPVPSEEPLEGEIALPAGARILSHAVSGNQLTLHLRLKDGSEAIHLYDMDAAKPVGRFSVVWKGQ